MPERYFGHGICYESVLNTKYDLQNLCVGIRNRGFESGAIRVPLVQEKYFSCIILSSSSCFVLRKYQNDI